MSDPVAILEILERAHPNTPTEPVGSLVDHDETWYMDYLETAFELELEKADLFDQTMETRTS